MMLAHQGIAAVLVLLAAPSSALAQGWSVTEEAIVEPNVPFPAFDELGASAAIDGDTAVFGAPDTEDGAYVRVEVRVSGAWVEQATIEPVPGAPYDPSSSFGFSVAVDGDTIAVGSPDQEGFNISGGSVLVYTRTGSTWTEEARFTGSLVDGPDHFGTSVALDGDTLLVGALYDEASGTTGTGGAYVFTRSGTTWSEQGALFPINGKSGDEFGISVDVEGDLALIGSSGDEIAGASRQGSAYFFERSGTTWSQQTKLRASDGIAFDYFGTSVSLQGTTGVVGAIRRAEGPAVAAGAAYVYTWTGSDWSEDAILTASDAETGDQLGNAVALSGGTLLVGASRDDHAGGTDAGSVRVFVGAGSSWSEETTLTASEESPNFGFGRSVAFSGELSAIGADGAEETGGAFHGLAYLHARTGSVWSQEWVHTFPAAAWRRTYGTSLSVSGSRALVGDPSETSALGGGGAYVFERSGSSWAEEAWLRAPDGTSNQQFGASASLDGDVAVVGSFDLVLNADEGAAYVFERGSTWDFQAKLVASDGQLGDWFGASVALFGDTLVVGAARADPGGMSSAGAAYVFERSGTTWLETAKLTASDPGQFSYFGWASALSGDRAVIGAWGKGPSGAAYVFVRSGTDWVEEQKLVAGPNDDGFGKSLSIEGTTVLVGAPNATLDGAPRGAAFVFERAGTTWGAPTPLFLASGGGDERFGDSVDLDGDLAVIGAPHVNSPSYNAGAAYAYVREGGSWTAVGEFRAAGVDLTDLFGSAVATDDHLILCGALEVYDEGYDEEAESTGAPGNTNGPGSVYSFVFSGDPPETYCTAGTSAGGCQAALSTAGSPSANQASGFVVSAANVEGGKTGLFYFGTSGRQANPWGNGTSRQCVTPPVKRAGLLAGSGTSGACDGTFAQDLNALWAASPSKNPGTGALTQIQLWYRDPQSTSNQTTSLSDAIEVTVGP